MRESLLNTLMKDGSRKFTELPQSVLWHELRDHIAKLQGANLTGFITDRITEAWIDFTYAGYEFTINDQYGEYWFFVNDATCPDHILRRVESHFGKLLDKDKIHR